MLNFLYRLVSQMGAFIVDTIWQLGFAVHFLAQILWHSKKTFFRPILISQNIYFSGVLSLLITLISSLFVGMVLGLQSYHVLLRFGSPNALGAMVAVALLRELGPVLSALLFAGRAGSAITAGIGLMKATEQLDAMRAMAVDPIDHVIAPKFWGIVIAVPILASMFNVVGILGSYIVGVLMVGLDHGIFWSQIAMQVDWHVDIVNGLIKSITFGINMAWIAIFKGYTAVPTAEGVAQATTQTVVLSALSVLALDFILTAFMF
ncbi:MAG: lipid asymmetry maintenance ABC transporter permease subunit MlaE [Neisseriales bacterium]|nr:MAG: lipid asymmetry maintenance ABC transporter permease subunit MlaE [Neisseriales bacterium]